MSLRQKVKFCENVGNISNYLRNRPTFIQNITKIVRLRWLTFDICWRALARQLPILYNSEKKAKSAGKIKDMRSRLCVLYPGIPGCLWMHVEMSIDFEQ